MAKSTNQKLKLLYLLRIFWQESDEENPLSVQGLIAALDRHGIAAERKSIYDDIEALRQFGLDIVTVRGRGNAYFLGARDFELPELKLLVDAVGSAKFITAEKSRELIRKICTLTSRHEGGLMQRQVHVAGRPKTVNKRIYYNVDTIHTAMAENGQICFTYGQWAVNHKAPHLFEKQARRDGKTYQVSPWTLLWDDEYYYLVAWDADAEMMKHYRVDRMEDIAAHKAPRLGREAYEATDMARYSQRLFNMYGGKEETVRLRFADRLIGVAADRFGPDIIIHGDAPGTFILTTRVVISPLFFSWLFGFGADAELLEPDSAVRQMRQMLKTGASLYQLPGFSG